MKQKLFLLLCALLTSVGMIKADEPYVYKNTFDDATGLTAVGSVSIGESGDDAFGNVYKNPGGSPRSSYYVIPSEVLHQSASSNQITIAFWVKVGADVASDTYLWAPVFTAFESSDKLGADNWTHLGIEYRGVMEYNLNGPGNSGENWCDFTNAQQTGHGGGDVILYHGANDWLKDKAWHHMAIVYDAAADGNQKATIYMDGGVANEWTLDGSTAGQDLRKFFSNAHKLEYVCFGGCQIRGYSDNDAPFWYDDLYITNAALSPAQIQKIIFDKDPAAYIAAKKGDLTSIINGDFQTDASGWTGGALVTGASTRSWRGTSYSNYFYEANYTSDMQYVLDDMPAGTYKVVAAARAWDGTITAKLNSTSGTPYDGIGDLATLGAPEINLNGVQMPYSNLGGFTSDDKGHNWRWIYATATLAEAGTLTITFNAQSNSGDWRWMCIDDVHLYCTNLDETSYTTSLNGISSNTDVPNTGDVVVTCDITVTNPNVVFKSNSGAAIATAAGQLNNCLYNTNAWYMTKMILYDGYDFEDYRVSHGGYQYFATADGDASCTLYRNIPADTWCTLTIPFWPNTTLEKKYPSSFNSETGELTFADVTNATCWNNEPMLIRSSSDLTYITGKRAGTKGGGSGVTYGDMISGEGVPMKGVYETGAVPVSDDKNTRYAVVGNELHKVSSGATVNIKPFRAYFELEGVSDAREILLNFDDETAINAIEAADADAEAEGLKDGKYFIEGKIVIVKNAVKYSANGQIMK